MAHIYVWRVKREEEEEGAGEEGEEWCVPFLFLA